MRIRSLISTVAVAALLGTQALAAPAAPPQPSPREEVAGIAATIEARYFDPAKGKAVADGLRADAAKGAFDSLTDPRDLATALTRRLQPLDHHFSVVWPVDPPPGMEGGPGPGPGPGPQMRPGPPPGGGGEDPFERRGNYGFRQVSILPGNLGYIDMRQFADLDFDDPASNARAAADAALQLVSHTDAVIIDLRDNGGGSPAMVGYMTSAFTPKGADIYNTFHYRQGVRSEAPAVYYPHPRLETPLYILTSARTGSAAEALAYTLKNAGRAAIVGEASGGAANPGGRFPAGNRFAVFVSTGAPESPITHSNWEGAGVQPDIAVPAADALDRARLLALESAARRGLPPEAQKDNAWALQGLKAELAPPGAVASADYVGGYSGATISAGPEGLSYQRGRRMPWKLIPLGPDLFTVRGTPGLHMSFERDAAGKVTVLNIEGSDGARQRLQREP